MRWAPGDESGGPTLRPSGRRVGATPRVQRSVKRRWALARWTGLKFPGRAWQHWVTPRRVLSAGLLLLLLATAIAKVYVVHENRSRFAELEMLRSEAERLEQDWSRLLLEESAWSAHPRIEALGVAKYGLHLPEPAQIEVLVE